MVSLKEDRELRLELLKAAGWNIARASEFLCWIQWGCTADQMRDMNAQVEREIATRGEANE